MINTIWIATNSPLNPGKFIVYDQDDPRCYREGDTIEQAIGAYIRDWYSTHIIYQVVNDTPQKAKPRDDNPCLT